MSSFTQGAEVPEKELSFQRPFQGSFEHISNREQLNYSITETNSNCPVSPMAPNYGNTGMVSGLIGKKNMVKQQMNMTAYQLRGSMAKLLKSKAF